MRHPRLYQLNTRIALNERALQLGRPAMLDDVDDSFIDQAAKRGFEWLWLLGVWQTGQTGRMISRSDPKLLRECREVLADFSQDDISGSPFSVQSYDVHRDFGGDASLGALRQRVARRSIKLLLDFVPNHVAPDHPWVVRHPEYFVHGTEEDLARQPQNYTRVKTVQGSTIMAYGRDPYFDGWSDTLQLNYRHAGLRDAMRRELLRISDRCDGVRCDMAMLVQPEIFQRTWGDRSRPVDGSAPVDRPFWPDAIREVRERHSGFLFVAEVYWGMEWELQQAGFDYTYDKRLYDRLRAEGARPVREHLMADAAFQDHSLRFLENHDEPRAASMFPRAVHEAAAIITFFVPGLRFFHEGQLEGRRIHVSMHVRRRPPEQPDRGLSTFYERLLTCLRRREPHDGQFRLHPPQAAWQSNPTCEQFIAFSWEMDDAKMYAVVNYGPTQGQCYVPVTFSGLAGRRVSFVDLMGNARYERAGDELLSRGLYLDMPSWGYHLFEVKALS
jgi:hypothetical protein